MGADGDSRLLVEYVEKNFTSGGKKTLWVQYIPDVSTGVVDNTNVSVSIKTQGLALKEGTAVTKRLKVPIPGIISMSLS